MNSLKKYIYQEDDYMQSGGLPDRYKKLGFSEVNQVKNAPQGDSHKKMVVAKKGDKYKLVKFGYRGMEDYTQHKDKDRRKNYLSRSGGIRNGSGQLTKDDVFSPNFWSRKNLWNAQTGGETNNLTIVENGEYVKDNQGKIGKITNIPSHDDNELIIDGESQYVPEGQGGQGTYNVNSVLSATHENRNQSDNTYGRTDEEIKIKPQEALTLAKQLNLIIKRPLGSISPSKLMDKLLESRDKLVSKYKNIDKPLNFERQANSFVANVDVLKSIPTPEDIYEFLFQNQEESKSENNEMYAQTGIQLDPAKRGTFKAQATRMGMSVQEAARKILDAPEGRYTPEMRKKANFAFNSKSWKHQTGGLKKSQQDLKNWSDQKWRTNSGEKSSETGERYLPDAAWDNLSASEKARTNRAKREGGGTGRNVPQPKDIAEKTSNYRKAQYGLDDEMYYKSGGSTVNSAGNYTKPEMRKRLFNRIKGEASMGTAAGQWSARKAQKLAKAYKDNGGGYRQVGGQYIPVNTELPYNQYMETNIPMTGMDLADIRGVKTNREGQFENLSNREYKKISKSISDNTSTDLFNKQVGGNKANTFKNPLKKYVR